MLGLCVVGHFFDCCAGGEKLPDHGGRYDEILVECVAKNALLLTSLTLLYHEHSQQGLDRALEVAVARGNSAIAQLLLECGAQYRSLKRSFDEKVVTVDEPQEKEDLFDLDTDEENSAEVWFIPECFRRAGKRIGVSTVS